MAPLRDRFVCCWQMFCSPQWQQWCCTWRSLGRVPARCLDPCVWCCCWVPFTARLCRPSPAGGPRAVQLPAAPPALRAGGGGCLIVRHCTLICLHQHTLTSWHITLQNADRPLINLQLFSTLQPRWYFHSIMLYLQSLVIECYFYSVSFRPRKGRGLKKSEEKNDSGDTEQQGSWQFEESQRLYRNEERRVQSLKLVTVRIVVWSKIGTVS